MKHLLLLVSLFSFSFASNGQSNKNTDINNARKEAKQTVQEVQTLLNNIDWKEFSGLLNSSLQLLEKNIDVVMEEVEKIDFKKIEQKAQALTKTIEASNELKQIQKSAKKIADKVQLELENTQKTRRLEKKTTEI